MNEEEWLKVEYIAEPVNKTHVLWSWRTYSDANVSVHIEYKGAVAK